MVSQLWSLLADGGKSHPETNWPQFIRNQSRQFEARTCAVEIVDSPATKVWFTDMVGTRMPIAVAHGEGRAAFTSSQAEVAFAKHGMQCLRYVDGFGQVTETYPLNPNGSSGGLTGVTSADGRVLIMMPHPERVVRSVSNSYYPFKHASGEAE